MLDAVIISYQKSVSHILQEYKGCKNEQKKEKKKTTWDGKMGNILLMKPMWQLRPDVHTL